MWHRRAGKRLLGNSVNSARSRLCCQQPSLNTVVRLADLWMASLCSSGGKQNCLQTLAFDKSNLYCLTSEVEAKTKPVLRTVSSPRPTEHHAKYFFKAALPQMAERSHFYIEVSQGLCSGATPGISASNGGMSGSEPTSEAAFAIEASRLPHLAATVGSIRPHDSHNGGTA